MGFHRLNGSRPRTNNSIAISEMSWIERAFGHMRHGMFINGIMIQREEKCGLRPAWADL